MCGINIIAGPYAGNHRMAMEAMNATLLHRGPDAGGIAEFDQCLLGHRRLKIVDLSGGVQPMAGGSGTISVTFNGEIYGYKAIRSELDYPFRTNSDTEVLLALYEKHGRNMLRSLPGMFAFAIWDESERGLFAARDRMGEKPFYYALLESGGLIASSEIKAILASGLVDANLDRSSLSHYLQYGYSPAGRTIYKEIHSLKPAHALWYHRGLLEIWRYWDYPASNQRISEGEAVDKFTHLFHQSVARQMVADVEVAAFLSGGLDSSSVVASAAQNHHSLQTISYGFDEPYSELSYARDVSNLYGTRHTEIEDREQDLVSIIRKMPHVYDEPFWDSSAIPTWLICRRAAEHVKVVLTGDGGDEIVGGYNYWYKPIIAMHEKYPRKTKLRSMLFYAARLSQMAGFHFSGTDEFCRIYGMRNHCGRVPQAHHWQQRVFSPKDYRRWNLEPVLMNEGSHLPDEPGSMFKMDLEHYMPGDILVKTDRASMAHSLELRAPFLDTDLVEFCLSLPYNLIIHNNTDKYLLRKAMDSCLPDSVRNREKKGFGAPLDVWMLKARELLEHYVFNPAADLYDLLPGLSVSSVRAMNHQQQWSLLMLSIWLADVYRKGR